MKHHTWKLIQEGTPSGHDLYQCEVCKTKVESLDKPWHHAGVDRVYITAIECGGGMANEVNLADCNAEIVRLLMEI